MKKLILSALFLNAIVFAQSVDYNFEQYTSNYTNLNNPISINSNLIWDDETYNINLGFDVKLFNITTQNMIITGRVNLNVMNLGMVNSIVASNADLVDRGFHTDELVSLSPISYQIDELNGSKVLKVEWKNAGFYIDNENRNYVNYQIWVYENSNRIEIHYGPSNTDNFNYGWVNDFCAVSEMVSHQEAHSFMVQEIDNEFNFSYQNVDEIFTVSTFTKIPEEGTVFCFSPTNQVSLKEKDKLGAIYPNPVTQFLNIENQEREKIDYKIRSLDGRIVQEGTSSLGKIQLNLAGLKQGIYLLNYQTNKIEVKEYIAKL